MSDPWKFRTRIDGPSGKPINDLNVAVIANADGPDRPFEDYSTSARCGCSDVYFRNLEAHLIRHIQEADFVMGCVAWLTSSPILNALSELRYGCQIVVQKEDFLRPDGDASQSWKRHLRSLYDGLRCAFDRYDMPDPINNMSVCGDPTVDPVRCVGNHNANRMPAFPRAHHKFVLFCKGEQTRHYDEYEQEWHTLTAPRPYAVWTGSFNFTANGGRSLENAIYSTDPDLVEAYKREYAQILAISEALDWSSTWVTPEWRIGT